MSARFEIVRTDAGHHVRLVAGNGKIVWSTEVYTRRAGAEGAIGFLAQAVGGFARDIPTRDVDDRTQPFVATIEPPFHSTRDMRGETFWHDREYHWRNCDAGECVEGTPPTGTLVAGRFGKVKYAGVTL